jgi:peroxiredoxin
MNMIFTKKSRYTGTLFIACILLALTACQGKADDNKAPGFTLLDLKGNTVELSDFSGKVVLINFFATYCPPCRMEMPDFVRLQKEFGDRGFQVVAISVDNNPDQVLPPFIARLGINFPVLLATSKVLQDYGNIYALPVTFILDREHNVAEKFMGMVSEGDVKPLIERLLEKK